MLIDLFCGAGVGADGYRAAGFDIVGVDTDPKALRHYTPGIRVLDDALSFPLRDAALVHASPPCQAYSVSTVGLRNGGKSYPDLLARTRAKLKAWGGPYVIENVPRAPMAPDLVLCGCQFGLRVQRVRWFETNWLPFQMMPPCHHPEPAINVTGHHVGIYANNHKVNSLGSAVGRKAMGVERAIPRNYLSQGIPPAYTAYIGRLFLAAGHNA